MFRLCFLLLTLVLSFHSNAQRFLTDLMDTSNKKNDIFPIENQNDKLRFGGYMQPQYQVASSKGASSFSGGDFSPNSNNRFMLRRGRIRLDYAHFNDENQPQAYFVFQFDGTERGVAIRDFWGRFYENKWQLFALTTGVFARPMGFEVNLSSSEREAPERGRMSQILMKTERDIGAMLTLEPRKKNSSLKWLKVDLGVFNGQGLAGTTDFDSYKDIIGRVSIKPRKITSSGWTLAAGASILYGGIVSRSPEIYRTGNDGLFYRDSTAKNLDGVAPRHYYGADMQLKIPNKRGYTEFRAEYIRGSQTAVSSTSETPGVYPVSNGTPVPLYVRSFDGAYFCFLQNLWSKRHILILKYDWYNPNTAVSGRNISVEKGFSQADIRYNTYGFGYLYHLNPHVKLVLYYDYIVNEKTSIKNFEQDIEDNVFTCRLQFRF